jgi:cytoskeletal protein RodZ
MQPELSSSEPIPFTVGTSYIEKPGYMKSGRKKDSRSSLTVPLIILAILVIGAGLLLFKQKLGTNAAASTSSENAPKVQEQPSSQQSSYAVPASAALPASNTSGAASSTLPKTALVASNATPALPDTSSGNTASVANSNSNSKTSTANSTATGSLAVSCAIAAEIYMGEKHLGSTPATLQLPAGNQTLEYRHGDLRATVTHAIKAKETTTALVVFDAVVQVNARPWATVSIEGSPRLTLGQTPLSDVRLPVGSVLIFENPNFPSKNHKIDPDDKAIQMVFP